MVSFLSLLFLLILPFSSEDLSSYLAMGHLESYYHLSAYDFTFHHAPHWRQDPYLAQTPWGHIFSPYGPLWQGFVSLPFFSGTLTTSFLILRFTEYFFHLGNSWLLALSVPRGRSHEVLYLYGLNPLLLFETVGQGHNDEIFLFFFLFAFYLYKRRAYLSGSILYGAAMAIKLIPLLLLPVFVLSNPVGLWFGILSLVFLALAYSHYGNNAHVLQGVINQSHLTLNSLTTTLMPFLSYKTSLLVTTLVFISVATWYVLIHAKEIKTNPAHIMWVVLLLYLWLGMHWFEPWYMLWLLPLALLNKERKKREKAISLTLLLMLSGEIARFPLMIPSLHIVLGLSYFLTFSPLLKMLPEYLRDAFER